MEEVPDTHYQLTNKTQGFVQMSINLVLEMGYGAQTHMLCEVCMKKTTVLANLSYRSLTCIKTNMFHITFISSAEKIQIIANR